MLRRCVRSSNLVNEEALANWGAVAPNKKKIRLTKYSDLGFAFFLTFRSNSKLLFTMVLPSDQETCDQWRRMVDLNAMTESQIKMPLVESCNFYLRQKTVFTPACPQSLKS